MLPPFRVLPILILGMLLVDPSMVDLSDSDDIITKPPSDVDAPLYSNATLTCDGTGTVVSWSIDGCSVSRYPSGLIKVDTQTGSDEIISSTLTIPAILLNGRRSLTISCFMALTLDNTEQKGASLTIQSLDPPENISVDQTNSSSYNISWKPPSSVLPQFYDKLVYTLTIAGKSYTTYNTFFELSDHFSCDMVNVTLRVNSSSSLGFDYTSNDTYLPFNFSNCGNSDGSGYNSVDFDSSLPSLMKTVHQSISEPFNIGSTTSMKTPDSNQSISEPANIGPPTSAIPTTTPGSEGGGQVDPIIAVVGIVVGSVVVIIICIFSGIYWVNKRRRSRAAVNSIELSNRSKISQQPEMESTTQSQNKKNDTSRGEKAPVHNSTPVIPPSDTTNTQTSFLDSESKDPVSDDTDFDNEIINGHPDTSTYSLVYNGNDSYGGGDVIGMFNPPFGVIEDDTQEDDNI